ncbi:hypothetical protein PGH12_09165 [Chryseobacterium wangxinyae]|uniref:hypothetical protein n=1 Tax=Chryseobacterium sp. CY350 TaxID=2997336 RepID=UPI00226FEBE6|nr:hypothetical protein [Chryseobacterium sp. CY350]MCY0978968.1 hypothetical protein [Chryseobacterium sp. CY350]WBZ97303.1 hypothetical protein PGH12_09165 [Chryseobacterium sp. CY350]
MKIIILFLFMNIFFVKAQGLNVFTTCTKRPITDTVSYLKKIEINKEKYIGKPFSNLLNDLGLLKPKITRIVFDKKINTIFKFSERDFYNKQVILIIFWEQNFLPMPIKHFEKVNNFRFTTNEKNFYIDKTIKDIIVCSN